MGKPEFDTSTNMNIVGLMLRPTRAMWINGKKVIMDSGFCVLKGPLEMSKRGFHGSALMKIGYIGLGGFMEMELKITSV